MTQNYFIVINPNKSQQKNARIAVVGLKIGFLPKIYRFLLKNSHFCQKTRVKRKTLDTFKYFKG